LAPFSYFNVVNHDPPVFTIGFSGGFDRAKDSLRNLKDSGECSINIISEHFLEAANACSINAPYGISEWVLTGLHPAPCTEVKASRVKEAIFSIEGKLMNTQEFESRATPGKKTGVLAVIEGVRFWAREDAINEDQNLIDPSVLRPISRMGGITYGRVMEGLEILRPDFGKLMKDGSLEHLKKPKTDEQSQL
jgi:flavin reductase (DIM6/NTAB) family NADH-FMN oxidoreductase RutF